MIIDGRHARQYCVVRLQEITRSRWRENRFPEVELALLGVLHVRGPMTFVSSSAAFQALIVAVVYYARGLAARARVCENGGSPRRFGRMLNRVILGPVCCAVIVSSSCFSVVARGAGGAKEAYWPQWRGAGRDDVATDKGLLQQWPKDGPPLVWTANKLGDGYSSVIIDRGRIYTTGGRKDGEYLICLSDADGKEIWSKRIGDAWHDGGARSTPATDAKLVYALTPDGDLTCLAAEDGAEVWRKNLKTDFGGRMMSGWGFS